jgi:hypothetical protein
LGANGQEGGCAQDERQGGAAKAARQELHSRNVSREEGKDVGLRDCGRRGLAADQRRERSRRG